MMNSSGDSDPSRLLSGPSLSSPQIGDPLGLFLQRRGESGALGWHQWRSLLPAAASPGEVGWGQLLLARTASAGVKHGRSEGPDHGIMRIHLPPVDSMGLS